MPRSAEKFAGFRVGDQFFPVRHFPLGVHVFPADEAAVRELDAAVGDALREVRVASAKEIAARRERKREIIEQHPDESEEMLRAARQPFELARLRAFLAERRPGFERAHAAMRSRVDGSVLEAIASAAGKPVEWIAAALGAVERDGEQEIGTMVHATLSLLVERVQFLREVGAPEVILQDARQAVLRVLEPDWRLIVDVADLVPDRVHIATLFDPDQARPLLEVDAMGVVLLAAQCCVDPAAESIEHTLLTGLEWSPFGSDAEASVPGSLDAGAIAVAPSLGDGEGTVDGLDFAFVPSSSPLRSLAPGGAVLRAGMAEPEEE